jgi:hypothetical protein
MDWQKRQTGRVIRAGGEEHERNATWNESAADEFDWLSPGPLGPWNFLHGQRGAIF